MSRETEVIGPARHPTSPETQARAGRTSAGLLQTVPMLWVSGVMVVLGGDLAWAGSRELRVTPRPPRRYHVRAWLRVVPGGLFIVTGAFLLLGWERPLQAVFGPLGVVFGAWWVRARCVATGSPSAGQDT